MLLYIQPGSLRNREASCVNFKADRMINGPFQRPQDGYTRSLDVES